MGVLSSAAILFVFGPVLMARFGDMAGQGVSMILRIVTWVGFAFGLSRVHQKTRLQIIRLTALLVFVDQCLLKSIAVVYDYRTRPGLWQNTPLDGAIFATFMGYLVFLPIIIILAFLGAELGLIGRKIGTKK
jgi:hypothetical protein